MHWKLGILKVIEGVTREKSHQDEFRAGQLDVTERIVNWLSHYNDIAQASESLKLDDIRGRIIQLNPTQESCKAIIEFLSVFMVHKSRMNNILKPMYDAID